MVYLLIWLNYRIQTITGLLRRRTLTL